jgi:hypothetical protein
MKSKNSKTGLAKQVNTIQPQPKLRCGLCKGKGTDLLVK